MAGLEQESPQYQLPWLPVGDLTSILSGEETSNGGRWDPRRPAGFSD